MAFTDLATLWVAETDAEILDFISKKTVGQIWLATESWNLARLQQLNIFNLIAPFSPIEKREKREKTRLSIKIIKTFTLR